MEASWLILEDLDNAPLDVLSVLLPLIQRRILYVPDIGKTICAEDGFRLFATLRYVRNALTLGSVSVFWYSRFSYKILITHLF